MAIRRLGVAVMAGLLLAASPAPSAQDGACRIWRDIFTGMPLRTVRVETGSRVLVLRVKLADAPDRQAAGFQCATPAEIERHLILFDFGAETVTRFHMQNVPAALDIAFVTADGRIVAILRMEPSPTALYGPGAPFRYALEARAGFFDSLGVRPGAARFLLPPGGADE